MNKQEKQQRENEFQHYFAMFKRDPELTHLLNRITYPELFSDEFLHANSKFKDMNDLLIRSGFGIVNLGEVEQVNQRKWNEYIQRNSDCDTWHEFGKMAMTHWMKKVLELLAQAKKEGKTVDIK